MQLRVGFGKRLVRAVLPVAVPALIFLAAWAGSPAAMAAAGAVQHPSCFCGADFNRDGFSDRGTISSHQSSAFIHLWWSGKRQPLSLHLGRAILGVLAFDVDRDGDTDLVALKANLRVRVWLNDGHGRFVRRRQSELGISLGNAIGPGNVPEAAAFCSCPVHEDGPNIPRATRALAAFGPEPGEAYAFASGDLAIEDTFPAAIHPRGPPSIPLPNSD
jgi:hypothetical protein